MNGNVTLETGHQFSVFVAANNTACPAAIDSVARLLRASDKSDRDTDASLASAAAAVSQSCGPTLTVGRAVGRPAALS